MAEREIGVEEITDPAEFESLSGEWLDLWNRVPEAAPFQAPQWLLPWWKNLGGGPLRVVVFRDSGRLIGLAPLFIHTWPDGRVRRISWIGSGISDHLDILVEPAYSAAAAGMLFRHLQERRTEWEIADFQELGPESPLLKIPGTGDLRARVVNGEVCPVLTLAPTVERFRAGLNKGQKRSLLRAERKLKEAGDVSLKTAGAPEFCSALEDLFRLHKASWTAKDSPGVLADSAVQRFHCEAGGAFLQTGNLRLYSLEVGGRTIASLYTLVNRERVYGYLGGFDPGLDKFSPGSVLLGRVMEDCIRRGAREFDFLRGAENYKYAWGAADRPNYRLILWHSPGEIRVGEKGEVGFAD